jgi:hypothetical protein
VQKQAPSQKLSATPSPLSDGGVLNRIVAMAPAPVLPSENELHYFNLAERIIREAQPQDAVRRILNTRCHRPHVGSPSRAPTKVGGFKGFIGYWG